MRLAISKESCDDNHDVMSSVKNVFLHQSKVLENIGNSLDKNIVNAVEMIYGCKGKVIVSGMGKSGIIGQKIAATFASTGTPGFFVHPGEAYHGDLGMIGSDDLLLLISYSGETDEVLKLLPYIKHIQAKSVSITGNSKSTLARSTDAHLAVTVDKESCPNNLAPTTSTTATLVMGDAIAVALMGVKNFLPIDFARYHPGGTLGKKLIYNAEDIMIPVSPVNADASFEQIVRSNSHQDVGVTLIVDKYGKLDGIVTDGDLRRAIDKGNTAEISIKEIATANPIYVEKHLSLYECETILSENKVNVLVVVDGEMQPIGLVKHYDITNFKV